MPSQTLTFSVTRRAPELIAPAKPTPRELKLLSDLDDQMFLRTQISNIQLYRGNSQLASHKDPVKVIREAIAEALVFYYPLAGRLVEVGSNGKLAVDCTGEGVLFIEADADVSIDDFGYVPRPPFPCLDQLLFDVPHSGNVLGSPLQLFQVTRLKCGGFVLADRQNHTMSDAVGHVQFLRAVSEIALGATAPSVMPVWRRELLMARDPPRITSVHLGVEHVPGDMTLLADWVLGSFFFGPTEIATLRQLVPPRLRGCSTFELLETIVWIIRTVSLKYDQDEQVHMFCAFDARNKVNPPLPKGYYGNAHACAVATSTAGSLSGESVTDTLERVMKAKNDVTDNHMRSLLDLLVISDRHVYMDGFIVKDLTEAGFEDLDFGWGKAAYGGPPYGAFGPLSFFLPSMNEKREKGVLVSIYLPARAMELFGKTLKAMLEVSPDDSGEKPPMFIKSNQ